MKLKEEVFFRKESNCGGILVTSEVCFFVTPRTLELLTLLKKGGSMDEIAAALRVQVQNIAGVLDKFQQAGLLEEFESTRAESASLTVEKTETVSPADYRFLDLKYDAPLIVTLQINNECNLRCRHCFANANKETGERLTLSEMKGLVDELVDLEVMELVITGGEPLLSRDLFSLLAYGKEKGLKSALYTNGTVITPAVIDELRQVGVRKIQVSIDGYKPETHDNFRGLQGAMVEVVAGVKQLVENGFQVIVNTVVTQDNLPELRDLNQFLQDIGVKVHRFNRYFPIGQGKASTHLATGRKDFTDYVHPLLKETASFKTTFSESFDIICNEQAPKRCSAAITHCSIGLYGHVVPCNYMKNNEATQLLKPDNIKQKTLKEIWDHSLLFNAIRDRSQLHPCAKCEQIKICRGGCRSGALAYYQDLTKRDPFCPKIQGMV